MKDFYVSWTISPARLLYSVHVPTDTRHRKIKHAFVPPVLQPRALPTRQGKPAQSPSSALPPFLLLPATTAALQGDNAGAARSGSGQSTRDRSCQPSQRGASRTHERSAGDGGDRPGRALPLLPPDRQWSPRGTEEPVPRGREQRRGQGPQRGPAASLGSRGSSRRHGRPGAPSRPPLSTPPSPPAAVAPLTCSLGLRAR